MERPRPIFCNEQRRRVAIFSNRLDSRCAMLALWSPRSLQASTAQSKAPAKGGTRDHAPRISFSVRRDRPVAVDPGLRAWHGGVVAGRARTIRQHAVATRDARTNVRAAE